MEAGVTVVMVEIRVVVAMEMRGQGRGSVLVGNGADWICTLWATKQPAEAHYASVTFTTTLQMRVFDALAQRPIQLRYLTLMWMKCVMRLLVMRVIVVKMRVVKSLSAVAVVHTYSLISECFAIFVLRLNSKSSMLMVS